jgi:hypothetical protein
MKALRMIVDPSCYANYGYPKGSTATALNIVLASVHIQMI